MIDSIHNKGLEDFLVKLSCFLLLALDAFRSSHVASLYTKADEPSLYSSREELFLQYVIRYHVSYSPKYVGL